VATPDLITLLIVLLIDVAKVLKLGLQQRFDPGKTTDEILHSLRQIEIYLSTHQDFSNQNNNRQNFALKRKTFISPMVQKFYSETLFENEAKLKPSKAAIDFILNYSKCMEVRKIKKQKIFICKN
jgi:hypothetical protein